MVLDKLLYDEIHAVIHAMLGECFPKDLFWTSVGLLEDNNKLRWESHVNAGCPYAPCRKDSNGIRCSAKAGFTVPPCLLERIESLCEFRKSLNELEKITMSEDSFSMGDVSIRYFEQKKEHPYISLHEHENHPWISTKQKLVAKLGLEGAQDSSNNAAKYHQLAKACMPDGTTAALVPLVQYHHGKLEYIGAIVLCAKSASDIWAHLPRIKSNAIALAEPHRHIFTLTASRVQNAMNRLISIFYDYPPPNNLFEGTCNNTTCSIHHCLPSKDLHSKDCRLLETAGDLFNETNIQVQRSLFHYKNSDVKNSKIYQSHTCLASQLVALTSKLLFGDLLISDLSCEQIAWPTKPGLVSLLSIANVYNQLRSHKPVSMAQPPVKCIKLEACKLSNSKQMISFVLRLADEDGTRDLARPFLGHTRRAGNTAKALLACMYGDLHTISDLRRAADFPADISEKVLGPSEAPVLYPMFDAKSCELRLSWTITSEQGAPTV